MAERHRSIITPLPARKAIEAQQHLENRFVLDEYVARKDIQDYAQHVANEYKKEPHEETRRTLVLDALSDTQVDNLIARAKDVGFDYEGLTDNDKHEALKSIRKQIMYELGFYFDPDEYVLLEKDLKRKYEGLVQNENKVASAFGKYGQERVYKKFGLILDEDYVAEMMRAMEMLMSALDEEKKKGVPFPYIVDVERCDSASVSTLIQKLNLTTMGDELADHTMDYTGEDLLGAIRDCIRGAIFLEQHGLMLQDIDPDNIGINKDTKCGILFDLDGLYPIGKKRIRIKNGIKTSIVIGKQGLMPPEILKKRHISSAAEMVWQFGNTIQYLADGIGEQIPNELETLMFEMIKENPHTRIGLKEAEQQLSQFIAQIKDND